MHRLTLTLLATLTAACGSNDNDTRPTAEVEPGPGYALVEISSIDDPAGFAAYSEAAGPTFAPYDFALVAATPAVDRLSGHSPEAWTVVIQFESEEAAMDWYADPAYVAARPLRIDATGETQFSIVEGLAEQAEANHAALHSYLYVHVDQVTDREAFDAHRSTAAAAIERHGGVVLVDTAEAQAMEGEAPYAWTQLVGFPTTEALERWRLDPEALAAAQLRASSAMGESSVILPSFDPERFALPGATP